MENIGTYTDEKGALHLLILASTEDEAAKIAKAIKHTIDGEFEVLESKHVAAPAKKLEEVNGSQHPQPSDNASSDDDETAHAAKPTGEAHVVTAKDQLDDKSAEKTGGENPVVELSNLAKAHSDPKITETPAHNASERATQGKATLVAKKKKRSIEVQEPTMDLVYRVRGDTDKEDSETWSSAQRIEWIQEATEGQLRDMELIDKLVNGEVDDIRIMAEFLAAKGLQRSAYVTSETSLTGITIANGPTLDCVSSDSDTAVLLYAYAHSSRGYRVIGSKAGSSKVMMAVTTGNAPAAYKEEELYEDAVEYVSSYYRPKTNKDLTQKQKYMVFLLMVKSGWGRYSRLHFVWHKVDSNVASLHISKDDGDTDDDDDMPNLLYSERGCEVVLTSVNRKATAEKRHMK